jgi:CRISPR-associated protein Cas2
VRKAYIVSYDISDPKRLRRVFKTVLGYGQHIQFSVFRCELSERELVELRAKLSTVIHHDQDQILFIDIGPAEGKATTAIRALGRPYGIPPRGAIIF